MRTGSLAPMGGPDGVVEADETFLGRKDGSIRRRGHGHKNAVLSLITGGLDNMLSKHNNLKFATLTSSLALAASIGAAYAGFRCPMVAEPGKPIVWYNANSRFECGKDRIRAASEACMDKPHKAFNRCTQNLLNRP
jgi:hypothetical protein